MAAAHAIHNRLTAIEATHKSFHGEKVAFGTLVQLVLENAPKNEIEEVLNFCKSIGLPTTLSDLNVNELIPEEIMEVAKLAYSSNDTMSNMPFEVTAEDVYSAIIGADKLGKAYK